jgi:hypothetical protein
MDFTTEMIQLLTKEPYFNEVDYFIDESKLVYKDNGSVVKTSTKNVNITVLNLAARNIKLNLFINSKM